MITHEHVFIDGEWVPAGATAMIDVIDPATEEPVGRVADCSTDLVDDAVAAARRAFPT